MELTRKDGQYFWTRWMAGQTFRTLLCVFFLLSLTDLLATMRMLPFGIREGNALAESMLQQHGIPGFIAYKLLLVLVVAVLAWVIKLHKPRTANALLWGAILVMTYVTLLHIAIIATLASL